MPIVDYFPGAPFRVFFDVGEWDLHIVGQLSDLDGHVFKIAHVNDLSVREQFIRGQSIGLGHVSKGNRQKGFPGSDESFKEDEILLFFI